ncbi:MAG: TetR/AcrR family transcriptional regulator [Alphaproteobacteria bacterium]|nr:TetR/AcrR family transcriptional regulator [Alphaproteobacteria bacterium]
MATAHHRKKQPEEVRAALLRAAARLMVERGPQAATLDAVARAAGVSKGGLLHHFPGKQALFEALSEDLMNRFAARVAASDSRGPEPRGAAARAYLRATAAMIGEPSDMELWRGLLMAEIAEPEARSSWRDWAAEQVRLDRSDGAADPTALLICRLASDGLWLADMLGLYAIDPAVRTAVVQRLERLTDVPPPDQASPDQKSPEQESPGQELPDQEPPP